MPKAKPQEVMVMNGSAKTRFYKGLKLRPGVNSVPVKLAEEMQKNKHISKLVGISIVAVSDKPPATKGSDVPEAVKLVKDTNDGDLLDKYESEDGRPEVAKAIRDKREELKPAKKED